MIASEQTALLGQLRALLASQPTTREVSMFGGVAFMVNDRMVVSAGKHGDLLVRVPVNQDDELTSVPGANRAEMGVGRSMGSGWITVSAHAIASEEQLSFWLDTALANNSTP